MSNNLTSTETFYLYYVAFQYQDSRMTGFGNMELTLHNPITAFEHVQTVQQYLRSQGRPNALVLGFTLLRTETAAASGPR
jgi:hypothetical protein